MYYCTGKKGVDKFRFLRPDDSFIIQIFKIKEPFFSNLIRVMSVLEGRPFQGLT